MRVQFHFAIPAAHPSLPGHFPGRPVVPGVVILDEVVSIFCEARSEVRIVGFSQVKFLAPLRPEQRIEVSLDEHSEGRWAFHCHVDGHLTVTGQLRVAPRGW